MSKLVVTFSWPSKCCKSVGFMLLPCSIKREAKVRDRATTPEPVQKPAEEPLQSQIGTADQTGTPVNDINAVLDDLAPKE